MNVTIQPAYGLPVWGGTGAINPSYRYSTKLGEIMMMGRDDYWTMDGNLTGETQAQWAYKYLTVTKVWAVMIDDQIFRACVSKDEAEKQAENVIKTMKQIEALEENEGLCFDGLFSLADKYKKEVPGIKKVNLD